MQPGKLDSALHHHQAGRLQKAEKIYRKILKADPRCTDALHMLGLLVHQKGDQATAIRFLTAALEEGPASAELYTNLGTALLAQGRVDEAVSAFREAIDINPSYALAHNNLGNALRAAGDTDAAAASYRHAIQISPDYALAHFNIGDLLHAAGNRDAAIASFRHALALDPGHAATYSSLATLLMEKGDTEAARSLFRQAIQLDRKNAVARHMLAALEGQTTTTAPRDYVVGLFDGCADCFDRQLVDDLDYRAPQDLYTAVTGSMGHEQSAGLDVVDLGCGTGLCGPLFRGLARTLTGIDLSSRMLERARERNVYDKLVAGDITDELNSFADGCDLILAADVFIYVGALEKLFDAAARALKPGGLFAFSLEAGDDVDSYVLRPSGRYAHALAYVRGLVERVGLFETRIDEAVLRMDRQTPVNGYICVYQQPGSRSNTG